MDSDMTLKVIAVVVTHNRLELLKLCVAALKNQSRYPDEIIVVNCGSTDETYSWLNTQTEIITIHVENLGSAGGFNIGIREAIVLKADWILTIDDDCIPDPDYIKVLFEKGLPLFKEDNNQALFCGLVYEPSFQSTFCGVINKKRLATPYSHSPYHSEDLGYPFLFFHESVVTKSGLPNRNWFIWNDDSEWMWRIKKHNFKLTIIPEKAGVHYIQRMVKEVKILFFKYQVITYPCWKTYYYFRNNWLFRVLKGENKILVTIFYLLKSCSLLLYFNEAIPRFRKSLRGIKDAISTDIDVFNKIDKIGPQN